MQESSGRILYLPDGFEETADLHSISYGQRLHIPKLGWFEVTKINVAKQRLVLKPIPKPAHEEAALFERRELEQSLCDIAIGQKEQLRKLADEPDDAD